MNVILTAIGSMSALCAINKLHQAGHTVIGCDIYPKEWHYEASLCDVFRQAPFANNPSEYIPFLVKLAKENEVQYIIPLHHSIFDENGIVICMPSAETLSIVRNKFVLSEVFKNDSKVPSIPTYTYLDDLTRLTFPCVAKPRNGRSSEGLYYLQSASQLNGLKDIERYIFQEKIEGRVCTVDFVRNLYTDETFCVPREELLRTVNGAGITVRIFRDSILEELVTYIGKKLGICGVVNMEFIKNSKGYYLIDINPRFSAGIAFSCKTNYDFIKAHLDSFVGLPIQKPVEFEERIEVKYYTEK